MAASITHSQQQQLELRQRKALADALAGVVATLVSLWTFYPIDVLKTKLQAGTDSKQKQLWNGLFRGLPLKTLHAASSSFTYFYLCSSILSWWNSTRGNNNNKAMSPAVRLVLSSIAAMLNTCLTLPLDVLASQHQASHDKEEEEETLEESSSASSASSEDDRGKLDPIEEEQQHKMNQVWNQIRETPPALVDENTGEVFYDSCAEQCGASTFGDDELEDSSNDEAEGKNRQQETNAHYHPASNRKAIVTLSSFCQDQLVRLDSVISTGSAPTLEATKTTLDKLLSLWKGLFPSLLLCSNPSINYTVFDIAKTHLLQRHTSSNSKNDLTMAEAFLLGLFAKFCATMATYPLIRAKVMLMVTHRNSMLQTLIENYKHGGGIQGWYKGCTMQLLHTVLKSALLMMVKERIAVTTHRLLVPSSSNNAAAQKQR